MEKVSMKQSDLQTKIELVRLTSDQILSATIWNQQADTLLSILVTYEHSLLRRQLNMHTGFEDLAEMKQAIRDAGCLVVDIGRKCPQYMQGWYHGKTPDNMPQAFANLLGRAIMDLSLYVNVFESHFPELKAQFDEDRRHHANLIQEQEDSEDTQRF